MTADAEAECRFYCHDAATSIRMAAYQYEARIISLAQFVAIAKDNATAIQIACENPERVKNG